MASILDKKPETEAETLDAIIKIAADKHGRLLWEDHCKWLESKLREIARLSRRLKRMRKLKGHADDR